MSAAASHSHCSGSVADSANGSTATFEQVLADIRARDERDSSRSTAPLAPAADAVLLDTSFLSIEAAVAKVIDANPDVAQKVRDGKVQAAGALIGQVMKEMKGQADAGKARELILAKLGA